MNKNFLKKYLNQNKCDIIIAADKGLEILYNLNINPDYIIGDFDSINEKILEKYKTYGEKIKKLNPDKDFTDTHFALSMAIGLKCNKITIIGAIGTRLDHTIANIHILKEALEKNIDAKIVNEKNEIRLINKQIIIQKDKKFKYISIIPFTTKVEGINLIGMKYPLINHTLEIGNSLGISNEQIAEHATIEIKTGILMIIKSKD